MAQETREFTPFTDEAAVPASDSAAVVTPRPGEWEPPASEGDTSRPINTLGLAIYYLASLLFMYQDYLNIGVMKATDERVVVSALGMLQYPDISLVLLIGFVVCYDAEFRSALRSKPGVAFLMFLAGYSCLGVLMGNEFGMVRTDLRVWGWGIGGLAMFRIAMKMRRPALHILALCLMAGVMLYVSAVSIKNQMGMAQAMDNVRVWDLNVFNYAGMMIPLLGLVLTLVTLRGTLPFLGAALAFWLYFDGAILIGATRSLALGLIVVCLCASVSLLFHRDEKQITWQISPRAFWIGLITALGAAAVVATLLGFAFTGSTVLANRLSDEHDVTSGTDRLVELQDGLSQLGFFKGIVGGGLGCTFESIFDYRAIQFHIAIFTFLLKFGILPFSVIVITLYLVLPFKFLQAFLRPATLSPSTRTALLVVLPSVFGWLTILSTSGGYDMYYAIGLGMAAGVFSEVKTQGLTRLCR
jgi:hypothetical protein